MPFSMSIRPPRLKWIMREALSRSDLLPHGIIEKERTGLLHDFLNHGFESNVSEIKQLLNDDRSWTVWLDPGVADRSFDTSTATDMDRALAGIAVGYCLWRQKITTARPGIQ
jgi:hypothetical protein